MQASENNTGYEEDNPASFRLKRNILLTGFMGSGKTSVGKILARLLKVNFFDSDELITGLVGMSVNDIFRCYGEDYFRSRETEVLEILGKKSPGSCVVSTGGGAVLRPGNLDALRKNGIIVYLDVSAEEAYRRVKEMNDRPLLQVENSLKKIEELLQKRKPFYLQADLCISSTGRTMQEIAEEIINAIRPLKF
ncbi:MAG: shikimate kinase [Dethiobacter sp.]|jgi:shikimate kinase|nr:MAG: shikimate kinase [Dethiobacter sp.]